MVAAIKQLVTVDPDGNIVVHGAALPPGTKAEVIVLVDEAPTAATPQPDPFIAALDALQKNMSLDRATAERWAAEARTLRGKA
jgi:hypothetical protein